MLGIVRTPPDLADLLTSWELSLRAERKSDSTIKSYGDGVRKFLAWAEQTGTEPILSRSTLNGFIAAVLADGAAPATARARYLALRRFSAWLDAEDELEHDPLIGSQPPKLDTTVSEPLSDESLRALIKACTGRDMRDRRDEAIVRFMAETGVRAGEVVALQTTDLDLKAGTATVRRGKGGKGRFVPFGAQTSRALDRYLRTRRSHRLAQSLDLWLGDRGKRFSYYGLHSALKARAAAAGIDGFHPHLLRHTAAHRWLAAGGSEGGLMAVAGWTRPEMLMRYTQARASQRAAEEARDLNLGDL